VIVDHSHNIVAMVSVDGSSNQAQGGGTEGRGSVSLSVEEIRQVQTVLKEKGFNVEVDGKLGPRTKQMLMSFQRQQGFQATGEIDTETVSALGISGRDQNQGGNDRSTTGQGQPPGNRTNDNQSGNDRSTTGQGQQPENRNNTNSQGGPDRRGEQSSGARNNQPGSNARQRERQGSNGRQGRTGNQPSTTGQGAGGSSNVPNNNEKNRNGRGSRSNEGAR